MMFARLYWPGPPMTNILFFITSMLVCCSPDPLENEVLTLARLSVILGTTLIPFLLRRSRIGVLILLSYVVSMIRQLGRISEIYLQRRLILVSIGVTVALYELSAFSVALWCSQRSSAFVAYFRSSHLPPPSASTNDPHSQLRPRNSGPFTVPLFLLRTRVNTPMRIFKRSYRVSLQSERS